MHLCRNKASGKYFIYIDKVLNSDKGLFVTPLGKTKALELHLFDEPIEQEQCFTLSRGLVTDFQIHQYQEYERNRQEDAEIRKKERVKKYTYRQLIQKLRQLPPDKLRKARQLLETQL
ncbi:MAG: hypothetical protein DRJ18_01340 [Candidatus Methanomethylicota archaeon]|nr:MAG: hypothetical protein DRJ18_01340 [Candidatus Verstraetearchaeota archaeon]